MPTPHIRRKPTSHGTSALLRYLFPKTRQRARAHLNKLQHETLPSLRHRTHSRLYNYIVYRQSQKLKGRPGVLQRLRRHTRLLGTSYLENEARIRRQRLTQTRSEIESTKTAMSFQEGREPGARRRKLAGYLKAANELRQTYQQQYAAGWSRNQPAYEYEDETPGGFQDAAIVRSGEEEMIVFPSYARKHVKKKPQTEPGTIQEVSGDGRDARDTVGAGDAEFWKQQWDAYEDDNAVVDVDVRGWIYTPHKGQMSRKQRLFIGLARQLVGIQAPPAGAKPSTLSPSPESSSDPSPGHIGHRERAQIRQAQRDEILTAKEAEEILRKGEQEAEVAAKGGYSEKPPPDDDNTTSYRSLSQESINSNDPKATLKPGQLSQTPPSSSLKSEQSITPIQKRASWNQPADMSPSELTEANARLMARLRHFLAIPMANTPISVFFYNDQLSKQRTVYTNPSGHFSICAALDFVPTHVRILASDKLSATEKVIITEAHGVSVISDIDDTIKHSAISSGAREIFRNAFIRDLGDLTIEGVKEWYSRMSELGVKFHYVSNSPWQLYPVLQKYFAMAGLPPGSFHLKQYSGMLQGIFEPVAERKKSTLDKIARDFPERSFILIGDSGEADLEVYTDFVLENPGRVIAVFIRDVTTAEGADFFDPSVAAIAASLKEFENEERRRSKSLFPTFNEDHPELRPQLPPRKTSQPQASAAIENLIDLSDNDEESLPALRRVNTDTKVEPEDHSRSAVYSISTKSAPPPPRKPAVLRSPSGEASSQPSKGKPPPKPLKPSSQVHQSSPLSQHLTNSADSPSKRQPGPKLTPQSQQTYAAMARDKLYSVYNNLPTLPSQNMQASQTPPQPPPPPPPRRSNTNTTTSSTGGAGIGSGVARYPAAAASYNDPYQGMNKREALWRQRLTRAKQVLGEKGVVLRTWRVGTDVSKEAEKLIK
ncbi:actin patch protein 1, partial [Lojkania enalia]